jgi:hypothetical protein
MVMGAPSAGEIGSGSREDLDRKELSPEAKGWARSIIAFAARYEKDVLRETDDFFGQQGGLSVAALEKATRRIAARRVPTILAAGWWRGDGQVGQWQTFVSPAIAKGGWEDDDWEQGIAFDSFCRIRRRNGERVVRPHEEYPPHLTLSLHALGRLWERSAYARKLDATAVLAHLLPTYLFSIFLDSAACRSESSALLNKLGYLPAAEAFDGAFFTVNRVTKIGPPSLMPKLPRHSDAEWHEAPEALERACRTFIGFGTLKDDFEEQVKHVVEMALLKDEADLWAFSLGAGTTRQRDVWTVVESRTGKAR